MEVLEALQGPVVCRVHFCGKVEKEAAPGLNKYVKTPRCRKWSKVASDALGDHGIGNLGEAGDVRAHDIIALMAIFCSGLEGVVVD